MMRNLFTSLLFSVFPLSAISQPIDSVFVEVPDAVLPLLERNSRLDLLDLYNCNMTAKVYNDLGGEACLLKKDSTQFYIETTQASALQLRVLKQGKDTIYSCIRTVNIPERQSQIIFFDTEWNHLDVQLIKDIGFGRFWQPSDSLSEDRIESLRLSLLPAFIRMHWEDDGKGNPILVYEISLEGLKSEDRKDAAKCLVPLQYAWKEGNFVEL